MSVNKREFASCPALCYPALLLSWYPGPAFLRILILSWHPDMSLYPAALQVSYCLCFTEISGSVDNKILYNLRENDLPVGPRKVRFIPILGPGCMSDVFKERCVLRDVWVKDVLCMNERCLMYEWEMCEWKMCDLLMRGVCWEMCDVRIRDLWT